MTYDELLADNTALRVQMTTLMAQLSAVQASNEALALELARLKRQSFGVKSERRPDNPAQPGLFGEPEPPPAPEAAPAPPPPPPRRATPHGRRRPDREPDEQILVPAPTSCTRCGGGDLREISASTATRLEWRRGHFVEIRVRRPSCACAQCNNVETAPEPSSFALARSLAGNGLVARVVIDKFVLCLAAHKRNYAQSTVMRSRRVLVEESGRRTTPAAPHNHRRRRESSSLSGGEKVPGRRLGGTTVSRVSSRSAGSWAR